MPDTQVTMQTLDPATQARIDQLWGRATQYVQNTPYQAYDRSGVAGLQPMQLAAQDYLSRMFLGQSMPYQSPLGLGGQYQPGFNPFSTPFTPYVPPGHTPPTEDGSAPGGDPVGGGDGITQAWTYNRPTFGLGGFGDPVGFVPTSPTPPPRGLPAPGGGMVPTSPVPPPRGGFPEPAFPAGGNGVGEAYQAAAVARGIANGGAAPQIETGNVASGMAAYRDPFEDQVVSAALSDIDRSRQLATQDVRSQATMSGAFGGDRAAILEAETNRGFADQAARTAAQLRSQGFNRAADLAQQDAARGLTGDMANQASWFTGRGQQLQGAGLLSSFGGDVFNRTMGTADALSSMGAQQQNQAQAEISDDMSRFYEAQDYPMQQFGFLQSMATGMPYGMNTTTRGGTNRGAGFLGGAATGAGIGSMFHPVFGTAIGAGLGGLMGLL